MDNLLMYKINNTWKYICIIYEYNGMQFFLLPQVTNEYLNVFNYLFLFTII